MPSFRIHATAPVRICDIGCWTDTWFARHGRVLNIAVSPLAEVRVAVSPAGPESERIRLHPADLGEPYFVPASGPPWGPHPLLEAAIASIDLPRDARLEIEVRSQAPPGAGTGTSAAVTVALLGALDAVSSGRRTPRELARLAHRVETERLGRQSGIQDPIASACGGISFIEMHEYPHATVQPIALPDPLWRELERRLVLVYLGRSHDSSALHETVIRGLESSGPDSPALAALRRTVEPARQALLSGDLAAFGRAMIECTGAQARLHPDLVGSRARQVIEIARTHGAVGWKVNGAGGEGGTLTLLCGEDEGAGDTLASRIAAASPDYRRIPSRLAREGLRVSRQPGD